MTSDDDELEQQQQAESRRYRARMYSDVVLLDLDWDDEPKREAREQPTSIKLQSA